MGYLLLPGVSCVGKEPRQETDGAFGRVDFSISTKKLRGFWTTASIKGNAASIKKFYTFLAETNLVDKDDLDVLRDTIREEMPAWLAKVKRYG